MSRASSLARAIGSDGTLNVADVAGLAAVASSGSASDLGTGTLPNARLASGAAVANLGYTPVNKAGDTMSGPLTTTVLNSGQLFGTALTTSGGFVNTGVTASSGLAWEVFGSVNPNNLGSSSYRDVVHGYIYIGTGWNGSAITAYLQWVSVSPPAREAYTSGTGLNGNVIDVVFWDGTTEANTVGAGALPSNQLRIKIPNYNTSGGSEATFYISRRA